MPGAALKYSRSQKLATAIGKILGYPYGTFDLAKSGKICTTDITPTSNEEDHDPIAKGDIALSRETTPNRVYICTSYTSPSVFTWVRIDG